MAETLPRTCDCPALALRCYHMPHSSGEDLRLWLVGGAESRAEFTRRTGLEAVEGVVCPGCETSQFRGPLAVAALVGPGFLAEPQCFCRIPLDCSDDPIRVRYTDFDEALLAFEESVANAEAYLSQKGALDG